MVSVIIPTYGKPVFLEKAIGSVLNQTYSDWELIIVDDNNPDTEVRRETEHIVQQAINKDNRLKYIQHQRNKNGAAARNTGFAAATGSYISFLDSDDEYMPDRLQKCVDVLEHEDSTVGGVYTGCEFRRGGKTYLRYTDVRNGNHLIATLAGNFMFCTGSNIFVRRSVIERLNGFDEMFLRHQDYEFLVRFFQRYTLKAIPEVLVIKNNENFNVPPVEKMILIKEQYLAKYSDVISSLSAEDADFIYHTNAVAIAERALQDGKKALSKQYYTKAASHGHLSFGEKLRKAAFTILSYGKQKD